VRIKVRGGTVDHGQESLCESCRWSMIVRVECDQLSFENRRVPFPVMSCSRYGHRNAAGLREMEEIAWILRSDARSTKAGFIKSSKLTDEERYVRQARNHSIHGVTSMVACWVRSRML
jgi:hypothetical protein